MLIQLDVSYCAEPDSPSMAPPNFKSVSVPNALVARLQRLRTHLTTNGLKGLPAGARPDDASTITPSTALEVAIASAEHLLGIRR